MTDLPLPATHFILKAWLRHFRSLSLYRYLDFLWSQLKTFMPDKWTEPSEKRARTWFYRLKLSWDRFWEPRKNRTGVSAQTEPQNRDVRTSWAPGSDPEWFGPSDDSEQLKVARRSDPTGCWFWLWFWPWEQKTPSIININIQKSAFRSQGENSSRFYMQSLIRLIRKMIPASLQRHGR